MLYLETNDWVYICNVLYQIFANSDISQMQKNVLENIKHIIPFDKASFYLTERKGEHIFRSPVGVNITDFELQEYISKYEELDYLKFIALSAKAGVYRHTDLFTDATRESTDYYKIIFVPSDIHYGVLLTVVYNDIYLGAVSLYRAKTGTDFTDRDMFVLGLLKDHLGLRLYQEFLKEPMNPLMPKISADLSEFKVHYGLTPREGEIVSLLYQGLTNDEICKKLFISSNTLKKHNLNIYKKLGINNRLQLFRLIK